MLTPGGSWLLCQPEPQPELSEKLSSLRLIEPKFTSRHIQVKYLSHRRLYLCLSHWTISCACLGLHSQNFLSRVANTKDLIIFVTWHSYPNYDYSKHQSFAISFYWLTKIYGQIIGKFMAVNLYFSSHIFKKWCTILVHNGINQKFT